MTKKEFLAKKIKSRPSLEEAGEKIGKKFGKEAKGLGDDMEKIGRWLVDYE